MKKIYVIICVFLTLLLSILIYAVGSIDRTDYYYNGSHYFTDGIEVTDLALDGVAASDKDTAASHGYDDGGATTANYTATLTNSTVSPSLGSVSMMVSNVGSATTVRAMVFDNLNNATFNGSIGYKFFITSEAKGACSGGIQIRDGDQSENCQININPGVNDKMVGAGVCGGAGVTTPIDEWMEIVVNMSNGSNLVAYLNGVYLTKAPSWTGIGELQFYLTEDGGECTYFVDEFWVSNRVDRPSAGAAADTPTTPQFVNPTPTTGAYNNTNQTLNCSHSGTDIRYYLNVSLTGGNTDMPYWFNETPISDLCYQESANVSSACGGWGNGTYVIDIDWNNANNVVDGDWDTYGSSSSDTVFIFINYTKPTNHQNDSKWQVKDNDGWINLSIPASCWAYSTDILSLHVLSYEATDRVIWGCLEDPTTTLSLRLTTTSKIAYEEAMWWNLTGVNRDGFYKNFVTNFTDGVYNYECFVQNISNGLFSISTSRTLTIDTVNPTITITQHSSNQTFLTDNSTIISSYLNNLTLNISFFDTNLYQTLINITNESGRSIFSRLNTSITGTTVNHTEIVNISTLSLGDYTIRLIATDSHTISTIHNYEIANGLDYFRYTTKEGNMITIKSDTLPLTKNTEKLSDRYTFGFNYLFQKDTYKFKVTSYNKISYLKDSEYPAHFVVMAGNGDGNWIDFGGIGKKDIQVTKLDDYNYEVEITANGIKSFTFNSIGGLNKKEEHYKFKIGAILDIWVGNEEEIGTGINATATIGTQSANTTINTTPATLVNITKDITEVTLTSSDFGTEIKTISVTDSYHNLSFNMSSVSAVKMYFYDEQSNALIEAETMSVYLETTGFSNTYSIDTSTDNPYTITGLSDGLYKLKASSTNYLEKQYLDLNVSNITTTNLNIYLINDTLGSEITFNIVGESLNPLEDVKIVFTKLINGTRTIVAEENSDFAGQVIVNLDDDTQYTINFSKTNYEDKTITLKPKDSEYVITMISTVEKYNQSVYEGIRYRFEPQNIVLNNNTNYNFTFTLNSTVWDVTNCTLRLKNGTRTLSEASLHEPDGCRIEIEQNTRSMTNITSEATYELNSIYNFTVSRQYSIIYTYEGEFSLKNFLDDISDFSMAGFDSFGRMILAFIVIFVILAMTSMSISFENKEVPIFIFWALVGFFSFVGWFTLSLDTIPTGFGLKKYFIFYLMTLVCGGFIMDKLRR